MTSQRSHEDTNWRAALEEYRAAKDRAAGAFRPDAKTCADLLARVAGVVRKGRSSPAGHDDATQRAAAAREIVDACLLYTSPSPRDRTRSRMPSSA